MFAALITAPTPVRAPRPMPPAILPERVEVSDRRKRREAWPH